MCYSSLKVCVNGCKKNPLVLNLKFYTYVFIFVHNGKCELKKTQKHGCLYKDIFAEARFCKKLQLGLVMWNMSLLFSGVRGYSLGGGGVCTSLSDRFYMVFDTLNSVKAC